MSRPPKPMTRRRIEAVARHHIERWSASRARLEHLLWRRAERSMAAHGGDREAIGQWIVEVLDALQAEGHLDDARLARDKARRLSERGVSERAIRSRLSEKGLRSEAIGAAMQALEEEVRDPDLRAAAAYVRKRRLGPFRPDPAPWRERDLARLARAGFNVRNALRVLQAHDPAEVEALELGIDEDDP